MNDLRNETENVRKQKYLDENNTLKVVINRGVASLRTPSSEDQVSPLQQE